MSRLYEQKLLEAGIPYRIVRGTAFYERREVRDVLAVLKLAVNPDDRTSFERVAAFAVKGMGPKKREEWAEWQASGVVPASPAADFWRAVGELPAIATIGMCLRFTTMLDDVGAAVFGVEERRQMMNHLDAVMDAEVMDEPASRAELNEPGAVELDGVVSIPGSCCFIYLCKHLRSLLLPTIGMA